MNPQPCIAHAGEEGDCWRSALATVLNMDASDVPNFMQVTRFQPGKQAWEAETRSWLRTRGLGMYRTYCNGAWELDKLLEHFSAPNYHIPVIIVGMGGGESHAIVAMDGKVVHDAGTPLTGPIPCATGPECCKGTWWIYVVSFAHESAVPWNIG